MTTESFSAYLISKKIDPEKFAQEAPSHWDVHKNLFEQIHPKSFTAQKKFLINDWRKKFPYSEETKSGNEG